MRRLFVTFIMVPLSLLAAPGMAQERMVNNRFSHMQDGRSEYYTIRNDQKVKVNDKDEDKPILNSRVPRPYGFADLKLNGAGYKVFSQTLGVGLDFNTTRISGIAEVYGDNARKSDTGTGSTIGGAARAFYHVRRGWYVGAGAQWSKLDTSIYSKQAFRPTFGGGKDIFRSSLSARMQVMYILPGTDRLNAAQGPEFSLWFPSPAKNGHWFYRETLGVYEFHQTAVPGNSGDQNRGRTAFLSFGVVYRFGSMERR
jgi:hypothetical protein